MKVFLKFVFSVVIGLIWYRISETDDVAMAIASALFIFVLLVLLVRPIEFQSPEKREEYIQNMKEKRERKRALEEKQKEELMRLKKMRKIKDEQSTMDFKQKKVEINSFKD